MTTRALFASSRGGAPTVSFGAAVLQGLAPDGGLYVPLGWPHLAPPDFDGVSGLPAIAGRLLAPFLEGDPLARELAPLAAEALDFPAPLVPLAPDGRLSVLRSEERRVGKECRARWSPDQVKTNKGSRD